MLLKEDIRFNFYTNPKNKSKLQSEIDYYTSFYISKEVKCVFPEILIWKYQDFILE